MAVDLVYQASRGHTSMVRKLLEGNIHPDACNSNGETALFHAVLEGKLNTVKTLLKYGADPNRLSMKGLSPVNAACIADNVTALSLLIDYGGLLNHPVKDKNVPPTKSAQRHRSNKVLQFIKKLKEEERYAYKLEDSLENVDALDDDEVQTAVKKTEQFPGDSSYLQCIDVEDLKTLHDGKRFLFKTPKTIFRSATWSRVPVTVKTLQNVDYVRYMKKEIDFLSKLRHPNLVYLLAVITGPIDEQFSLILDHFSLGNLDYVQRQTNMMLNPFERLLILIDISSAMVYLHSKDIVHCYINSYSVFLNTRHTAKLGNLEYAQKRGEDIDSGGFGGISHLVEQHPWMCPEMLSGLPASMPGDVYSFGALFWECLTRYKPWSWLTGKTIVQAICNEGQRLPLLEWQGSIISILKNCLGPEKTRLQFTAIRESLYQLKTCVWSITNDDLEDAFNLWHCGERKKSSFRGRSLTGNISKITWNISSLSMGNEEDLVVDDSKLLVLCRRRSSFIHSNIKKRRNTIDLGLIGALGALNSTSKESRFAKDTEKYGLDIAEQLAFVRRMRKKSKCHSRNRWAKDTAVRRRIQGDIERLNLQQHANNVSQQNKMNKNKKEGTRVRRLSHGSESISKLQNIAEKYGKSNWARYTTGHTYPAPEDKYEMLSDEDFDEENKSISRFVNEAGTFVEYQKVRKASNCLQDIIPSGMYIVGLEEDQESESSGEYSSQANVKRKRKIAKGSEEVLKDRWTKEDNQTQGPGSIDMSSSKDCNESHQSQEKTNKNIDFGSEAALALDEFTDGLDRFKSDTDCIDAASKESELADRKGTAKLCQSTRSNSRRRSTRRYSKSIKVEDESLHCEEESSSGSDSFKEKMKIATGSKEVLEDHCPREDQLVPDSSRRDMSSLNQSHERQQSQEKANKNIDFGSEAALVLEEFTDWLDRFNSDADALGSASNESEGGAKRRQSTRRKSRRMSTRRYSKSIKVEDKNLPCEEVSSSGSDSFMSFYSFHDSDRELTAMDNYEIKKHTESSDNIGLEDAHAFEEFKQCRQRRRSRRQSIRRHSKARKSLYGYTLIGLDESSDDSNLEIFYSAHSIFQMDNEEIAKSKSVGDIPSSLANFPRVDISKSLHDHRKSDKVGGENGDVEEHGDMEEHGVQEGIMDKICERQSDELHHVDAEEEDKLESCRTQIDEENDREDESYEKSGELKGSDEESCNSVDGAILHKAGEYSDDEHHVHDGIDVDSFDDRSYQGEKKQSSDGKPYDQNEELDNGRQEVTSDQIEGKQSSNGDGSNVKESIEEDGSIVKVLQEGSDEIDHGHVKEIHDDNKGDDSENFEIKHFSDESAKEEQTSVTNEDEPGPGEIDDDHTNEFVDGEHDAYSDQGLKTVNDGEPFDVQEGSADKDKDYSTNLDDNEQDGELGNGRQEATSDQIEGKQSSNGDGSNVKESIEEDGSIVKVLQEGSDEIDHGHVKEIHDDNKGDDLENFEIKHFSDESAKEEQTSVTDEDELGPNEIDEDHTNEFVDGEHDAYSDQGLKTVNDGAPFDVQEGSADKNKDYSTNMDDNEQDQELDNGRQEATSDQIERKQSSNGDGSNVKESIKEDENIVKVLQEGSDEIGHGHVKKIHDNNKGIDSENFGIKHFSDESAKEEQTSVTDEDELGPGEIDEDHTNEFVDGEHDAYSDQAQKTVNDGESFDAQEESADKDKDYSTNLDDNEQDEELDNGRQEATSEQIEGKQSSNGEGSNVKESIEEDRSIVKVLQEGSDEIDHGHVKEIHDDNKGDDSENFEVKHFSDESAKEEQTSVTDEDELGPGEIDEDHTNEFVDGEHDAYSDQGLKTVNDGEPFDAQEGSADKDKDYSTNLDDNEQDEELDNGRQEATSDQIEGKQSSNGEGSNLKESIKEDENIVKVLQKGSEEIDHGHVKEIHDAQEGSADKNEADYEQETDKSRGKQFSNAESSFRAKHEGPIGECDELDNEIQENGSFFITEKSLNDEEPSNIEGILDEGRNRANDAKEGIERGKSQIGGSDED